MSESTTTTPPLRHHRAILLPVLLFVVLSLPYAFTKLNGDETHFVTIPYLMVGGDYTLSAVKRGDYLQAAEIAATSYGLAWRYFVRPSDADEDAAAVLSKYEVTAGAAERAKPFVFTPDYFVTHRKAGKPLLAFLLNIPALVASYALPRDLYAYQRDFIYHPAFLAPRLVVWLMGLAILVMIFRFVRERLGSEAGVRAALLFAVFPVTVVWTADIHQDVPLTFFLLPFFWLLWRRRLVWAGVAWGLAFATKNQAVFALAPIMAEGIWLAIGKNHWSERADAVWQGARSLAVVVVVGTAVSAPFAHPIANWLEVFSTSAPDITEIHNPWNLLYRLPIWTAAGMLAILALKLLDDVQDSFDRIHIFFLVLGALFYFLQDYRSYMFVPSMAILAGSYLRPHTARLAAAALLVISLAGLSSPYLTSRRLLYKSLNDPGAPQTIEEIERLPGIGSIHEGKTATQPE